MIREIDLLSYLPPFMKEYREMKRIMETENPELQILSNNTESIKNNQFILSCNEQGITRFEKMLGIEAFPSDSLQARIGRVWAKWIDTIPYTLKALTNKLDVLLGDGNYTLDISYNTYTVSVKADIEVSDRFKSVNELLEDIVPVNMIFDSRYDGKYDIDIETNIILYSTDIPVCGTLICGGRRF